MRTTLHVLVVFAVVEITIRWLPLPRLARLLGSRVDLGPVSGPVQQPIPLRELPPTARRQLRCTNRIAGIWPLAKGPCLRRALVEARLLRAHRPAVRIGITGSGDALTAHAWLEIRQRPLEDISDYRVFEQPPIATTATTGRSAR